MKNDVVSDIRRFVIHTVMMEAGIVPLEDPYADVNRALRDIDPEEARRLKRKFRKLWRKACRKEKSYKPASQSRNEAIDKKYGVGSPRPSRRNCRNRKLSVYFALTIERIDPLVKHIVNDPESPPSVSLVP